MKSKNTSKHEGIVDLLEEKLSKKRYYDYVGSHLEYRISIKGEPFAGEVDVFAFNAKTNIYYFFEVKCTNSEKHYRKALKQYTCYCRAHPHQKVIGVFVSLKNKEKDLMLINLTHKPK